MLKTCLDPGNKLNNDISKFKCKRNRAYGYRTRKAGHIDIYRDGWTYTADWFSTDVTECHPGLYIWPTLVGAKEFSGSDKEFIKVSIPKNLIHRAGSKYRCRIFTVLGEAK